ncbi:MAG: deoxyguanosinetriphosphate triphosphohydrolase-like protein [Alphaproteobacteria bacterium]|nr:MAG: deoxyguanosinetriphosphate triphosphohydrolase-like protein [Alphaproteobacteria bacterium]
MGARGSLFDEISFGREGLAAYACHWRASRGRLFAEAPSPTRSPFQRDRDRIVHSTAFRRLKYKTQVFVFHEGDHYRTRLTHSIEVAQIARALARALRVDEDLAEALALGHDFGHTPFGHTGEEALDELMTGHGGFDHNAQSLRIVTKLERRYAEFDGLNLSWETLDGLVKHNGPLIGPDGSGRAGPLPLPIAEFNEFYDLDLARHSGLEAQCAAIADDIAYNAHDLDDGLRAGLFDLDALAALPVVGDILAEVRHRYPGLDPQRTTNEVVRRQITRMVEDVLVRSFAEIAALDPGSEEDVRGAGRTLIGFGPEMAAADRAIKAFLHVHVYRAPSVMRIRANARAIVRDLFEAYFSGRAQMPNEWGIDWREAAGRLAEQKRARLVADFLAGMTDRYALVEHQRLFDVTPDLR